MIEPQNLLPGILHFSKKDSFKYIDVEIANFFLEKQKENIYPFLKDLNFDKDFYVRSEELDNSYRIIFQKRIIEPSSNFPIKNINTNICNRYYQENILPEIEPKEESQLEKLSEEFSKLF